jgi:hypothetical protein
MILKEIQSGLRELNECIGELFFSPKTSGARNRTPEHRLFDDAFKGLLNAGKMVGAGLKGENIDKVLKKDIEYNGVTTNLGEVLKNINWSQEQLNILNRSKGREKIEITDFSEMDLGQIMDMLAGVWRDALPPQLQSDGMEDVRQHLVDKMLAKSQFAGCLEYIIDSDRKRARAGNGHGYEMQRLR